jgi:hypothetical protein
VDAQWRKHFETEWVRKEEKSQLRTKLVWTKKELLHLLVLMKVWHGVLALDLLLKRVLMRG